MNRQKETFRKEISKKEERERVQRKGKSVRRVCGWVLVTEPYTCVNNSVDPTSPELKKNVPQSRVEREDVAGMLLLYKRP